ncbi:MAG TPA: hypothetical protein VF933_21335 [Streptosporangiaceae bacterium]
MFGVPGGGPNLDVVGAAAAAGLRFVLTHTNYSDHSPDEPMIHDFENAGDTPIRFTTVELLD